MGMPNLNYDDFYKFVTSFTIISFILSIYASYQQIARSKMPNVTPKEIEFLVIYFYVFLAFAVVSLIFFVWAIRKWKHNQSFYDRKLEAETKQAEIHTKLSKKELTKALDEKIIKFSVSKKEIKTKTEEALSKIDKKNLDLMHLRYLIEEKIILLLEFMDYPRMKYRSLHNSLTLLKQSEIFDAKTINLILEVIHICIDNSAGYMTKFI